MTKYETELNKAIESVREQHEGKTPADYSKGFLDGLKMARWIHETTRDRKEETEH